MRTATRENVMHAEREVFEMACEVFGSSRPFDPEEIPLTKRGVWVDRDKERFGELPGIENLQSHRKLFRRAGMSLYVRARGSGRSSVATTGRTSLGGSWRGSSRSTGAAAAALTSVFLTHVPHPVSGEQIISPTAAAQEAQDGSSLVREIGDPLRSVHAQQMHRLK